MNRGVLALRGHRVALAIGRQIPWMAATAGELGRDEAARAVDEFRTATRLQPELYHGYLNLAEAYRARNELGQAAKQLQEAIRLAGKRAALYRTLAQIERQRGNAQAALDDLAEAIRLE